MRIAGVVFALVAGNADPGSAAAAPAVEAHNSAGKTLDTLESDDAGEVTAVLGDAASEQEEASVSTKAQAEQAVAAHLAGPVPDYKKGFTSEVMLRPNLKGRLTPVLGNLAYEESVVRNAVGQAIEATLATEAPKLTKKLQANALKAAKAFAKTEAASNSVKAAGLAFDTTNRLLSRKASRVCAGLSRMKKLPIMCAQESQKFFQPVAALSKSSWATKAAQAAQKDTIASATRVAFAAVQNVPKETCPPEAYHHARMLFEKEWLAYKAKYDAVAATGLAKLAADRKKFWDNAQKQLTAKISALVKKTIWDKPMKATQPVIDKVAQAKASAVSQRRVVSALAPKFVKAAKIALAKSVRKATKDAMTKWTPNWALDGADATASKLSKATGSQSTDSWDWGTR
mmetsp:Transcript_35178/g.92130  ORF Transcript_35178/g.92130 Transcript_35178/m.92130 type:complete len:400 (+) Transcript_35178:93-1292(+)